MLRLQGQLRKLQGGERGDLRARTGSGPEGWGRELSTRLLTSAAFPQPHAQARAPCTFPATCLHQAPGAPGPCPEAEGGLLTLALRTTGLSVALPMPAGLQKLLSAQLHRPPCIQVTSTCSPSTPFSLGESLFGVCARPIPATTAGPLGEQCLGGCLDPEGLGEWILQDHQVLDLSAAPASRGVVKGHPRLQRCSASRHVRKSVWEFIVC